VGAFSLSQREAILAELELIRRSEGSDSEDFFNAHPHEPFFVKNLENIQGDERDIIFISVGNGKDASGYMAMNFGPLSADGGERRLNVLITRARLRCDIFSSITADDIDLDRGRSKGVAALKSYLQFAQTGNVPLGTSNVRDFDSPFEEEVYRSLTQLGYDVVGQVGIAGFFVDLAVRDESKPGRFILGIECDGVAYHSCRSARDRDRLRQQVLEDQGWFIHRIWSTDWLRAPEESLRRTVAAIESARAKWAERDEDLFGRAVRSEAIGSSRIVRSEAGDVNRTLDAVVSVPYREAFVKVDTYLEPHLVAASTMVNIVEQVVAQEGPIHREEVSRRVTNLWGLQRAGRRIVAAVDSAIAVSIRRNRLLDDRGFLDVPHRPVRSIRTRAECSLSLRKAEMLPPSEVRYAIKTIIAIHHGMTEDEAIQQVARAFGFAATSNQLRTLITSIIREMLNTGMIHISGEILQEAS
jgi:very-short-patch-repair endonuclease